jgi:hypothetical protein
MNMSIRSLVIILAGLALAAPALAQTPPQQPPVEPPAELDPSMPPVDETTPVDPRQVPPVEPPPVLDPSMPPVDEAAPVDPLSERSRAGDAAQLELDRARLQCRTLPEQQRQACLDAAQRAFEQARRRDEDPVR